MTGTELHRLANGEGTLYVDGTPIGGIREFSVGPLAEAAEGLSAASGRRFTVEDVAAALGVPVELLACEVDGCTSPATMHHHHAALSVRLSPLACRCRHTPAPRTGR